MLNGNSNPHNNQFKFQVYIPAAVKTIPRINVPIKTTEVWPHLG